MNDLRFAIRQLMSGTIDPMEALRCE